MASKLSINFDVLQSAIQDHQTAIDNLRDAVSEVDRAMNELQSTKWDTEASVAYFAQYSDEWRTSVDNHIVALELLRDSLINAQREYSAVYDQIAALPNTLNM